MRLVPWLALVLACAPADAPVDDTDVEGPDLVGPFGPDQVRAGVVRDPAALLGGLGAEARPGDVLLVNDRARFVIQAAGRPSGGLVPFGGGVLDADVVRADGSADVDLVVDWLPALDVGWLPEATSVVVVDDGVESGRAVVRVEAVDAGFTYLGAVLEDPGRFESRGIRLTTTYTLEPGSPLLRVETTIRGGEEAVTTRPGDVLQAFPGIASPWVPGQGRVATYARAEDAVMVVHDELGLALGIFSARDPEAATPEAGLDLLNLLISFASLYEAKAELAPGATRSWTRWWGVASTPSQLTDAWQAALDEPRERVEATVVAGGAPAAGVRVTVALDGDPYTLAITDAEGRVALDVPAGREVTLVADGSGSRLHDDLPAGAGQVSPLGHASRRQAALGTIRDGAPATPHARGLGRTSGVPGDTLTLEPAATLRVTSERTPTFEVQVRAVGERPPDDAWGLPLPDGLAAAGWARGGSLDLPLEAGTYDLVAWHGSRFEVHAERVELRAGEVTEVQATGLFQAWQSPGWWLADTHIHAAPSFDGKLTPTDRALVAAGVGLDLWFASEHDVAVDHRDLVAALGLDRVLRPVGSVEVTPWVRGHVNIFPNAADPDARAGGAWPWWEQVGTTTTEQFDRLLAHHDGVLVQLNHPFSPGMPVFARWSPGRIGEPDFWWEGFDAVEVIVPGMEPKGLDLYLDLTARGILAAATGSTDSHDHLTNDPGLLATWVYVPEAGSAGDITDAQVVAAIEGGRTVATNGPLLMLDPLPGSLVTGPTTLDVQAMAPSWMPLDEVRLYKDGTLETTVPLDGAGHATLALAPAADAVYVVEGVGATPMQPLGGRRSWVVASAVRVDVGGDGWSPPLPPLLP
ncbi:MAG: CehA/McbA family metallohydrolase [Alphaproteobacteria bacterium]|nr:CehA/McbA family metallohydrolase [Alphaproteobacteria bacterium]